MAPIDEEKFRKKILEMLQMNENARKVGIKDKDAEIEYFYIGKINALCEILTIINNII